MGPILAMMAHMEFDILIKLTIIGKLDKIKSKVKLGASGKCFAIFEIVGLIYVIESSNIAL